MSNFPSSLLLKQINALSERKSKIQESMNLIDELPQKLEHHILVQFIFKSKTEKN